MNQQLKASQSSFTPGLLLVIWHVHKLGQVWATQTIATCIHTLMP
jgi:hypothetical protein